jgi:tetratricopeptide (TPR) repeat protein
MDASSQLERASLLLEQGRYKDAEKQVRQVLEQDPNNDHALAILARCYMNEGQHDKGIEIVNKAISIEPNESFYFYLLGFAYYQKDMFLPAKEHLAKAIQLNPYNPEYFGLLAFIFFDEKNYEETLQKANEGLELDPENITCLNARSRALSKLKRNTEAEETISDTLSNDPDNVFTHTTVGWNYFERGNHKKAEHHFREALRIDPNFESARVGLKESLKSHFTPYKLIVQFSLWMSDKGKTFQWIFIIGLYVLFRVLRNVANTNSSLRPFLLPLIVFYFIFIFFTWIANPIANFFLLFHKDGKYSLTKSERILSVSTILLLVTGISLASYAFYGFASAPDNILYPGIILATLPIPLSRLDLPLNLNSKSIKFWYPFLLVVTGVIAIPIIFLIPATGSGLAVIYGIGLIIFTWVANAW